MGETSVVAIAAAIVLYLAYHFLSHSPPLAALGRSPAGVAVRRLVGVVFLGGLGIVAARLLLPLDLAELGLISSIPPATWLWVGGATAIIVPACIALSFRPDNVAAYPEMRQPDWGIGTVAANTLSSALYLSAYEFFFRGFLLFACLSEMSAVWAIAINIVLYAAAHIPKGVREALASLPFGIVLCLAAIDTGAIWAPFLMHFILSQTNDYLSLRANPAMRFAWKPEPS